MSDKSRELVQAGRLAKPTPDILYFLQLRLKAALPHVEATFAASMDKS